MRYGCNLWIVPNNSLAEYEENIFPIIETFTFHTNIFFRYLKKFQSLLTLTTRRFNLEVKLKPNESHISTISRTQIPTIPSGFRKKQRARIGTSLSDLENMCYTMLGNLHRHRDSYVTYVLQTQIINNSTRP